MRDLYVALLHHPVLDKTGRVVTAALTNMDIHDIARSARTYGVRGFYVVTPVRALQLLARKIIEHWECGYGSAYNWTRKEALEIVRLADDLDAAILAVEREAGGRPVLVATSARDGPGRISFAELRGLLARGGEPLIFLFGTGWGLAAPVLERADYILEPIRGVGSYNHLSVRAAAAIVLDRLLSRG